MIYPIGNLRIVTDTAKTNLVNTDFPDVAIAQAYALVSIAMSLANICEKLDKLPEFYEQDGQLMIKPDPTGSVKP